MLSLFAKKHAETLIEAVIAVGILALILFPAAALSISTLRLTAVNRDDLVASTLAEEGVEIMRNIRDSNVLKFSSNLACWNAQPDPSLTIDDCANFPINDRAGMGVPVSYRLMRSVTRDQLGWTLASTPDAMSTDLKKTTDAFFRLSVDESSDPRHQHFVDDTHLYFHDTDGVGKPTNFYREIVITNLSLASPPGTTTDALKVVSRVLYASQDGGAKQIFREVILTRP